MDKLEQILNNEISAIGETKKISIEETYVLVSQYDSKMCSNFGRNALFIKNCIAGFTNKIMDPNVFLTAAIAHISNASGDESLCRSLFLVSLALRFGAKSNLYVVYKGVGVVHIMLYTVMYLRNNNVDVKTILSVLYILTMLGSSSSSSSFSLAKEDRMGRDSNDTKIVSDWLYENGYYDFKNKQESIDYMKDYLSTDEQILIGVMIDNPDIAFPLGFNRKNIIQVLDENTGAIITNTEEEALPGPDLSQVIIYNAYKCLPYMNLTVRYMKGETVELKMCLDGLSLEVFKFLFDKGYKMTYFQINRLLALLFKCFKHSFKNTEEAVSLTGSVSSKYTSKISSIIYMEMLKYAVSKGLRIDLYQLVYLSNFASEFSVEINEIYSNPLWVKSCSASNTVPLPSIVKELAVSLNLIKSKDKSIDKENICTRLYDVSNLNREIFVESNKERQRGRMDFELKEALDMAKDFESGFSSYKCSNIIKTGESASLNGDPLDYSDDSLVYYTDKSKKTWCFTPNTYNELINTRINYYTNEEIPEPVINKMQRILSFMESLNIDPKKIVSVSKAINELNQTDTINNTHTDISINFVKNTTAIRGIMPQTLDNLTLDKILYILRYIGIDPDYLYDTTLNFPYSLVFATMCKALHIFAKKYDDIERAEIGAPTMDEVYALLEN